MLAELCAYRWPGNVRELENAVERAVALAGHVGRPDARAPARGRAARGASAPGTDADGPIVSLKESVRESERRAIRRALQATQGHRANAAKTLGISRKNLWEKMKEYEID